MVELEEDEGIDIESSTPLSTTSTTFPKKSNWFVDFRKSFRRLISTSELSQLSNGELERSLSTSSTRIRSETRMRNELRYYFMNPCQKFKLRRRKPFKLAIQIFKIALVTLQLIIFGRNNQSLVSFIDDTHDAFNVILLNNLTFMYTKGDVYERVNFIRQQYAQFENVSLGNYGFASVKVLNDCINTHKPNASNDDGKHAHPILMRVQEYSDFSADIDNNVFNLNSSSLTTSHYCLKPWTAIEINSSADLPWIPLTNGSMYQIKFNRLKMLQIYVGIRTVRLMSRHSYHQADLYNITFAITFDNSAHTGKMVIDSDVKFDLTASPYTQNNLKTKPLVVLLLLLDLVIIITCIVSLLLCCRSISRAQRLRKSFEKFYLRRYGKPIVWTQKLEFINGWYLLIIVSDCLTVSGSITKIVIEMEWKGVVNYDACSLCLGVGCLCVWVGVLRYAGFFHQYNILVLTLKKSLPHVIRFMVCASLLYLGFMFCGWVVLGPYHRKFRNPVVTSEALFSLINGDDMYMTFEEMDKKSNVVWTFSQIYLYIFISLFIYIVLSLFIAVIMETYETIKEWQTSGFPPQNEIQKFISEHAEDDESDRYDFADDIYCCCCFYHNNGPDIETDDSSDEELIET